MNSVTLVIFSSFLVLAAPLMSIEEFADTVNPRVTKCFYVEGDQLCQVGREKPLCRPLPKSYVESESVVFHNSEQTCLEKNTRTHVNGIVVSESRSQCGVESDIKFQLAKVDLLCQTWDGPLSDMGLGRAPIAAQ